MVRSSELGDMDTSLSSAYLPVQRRWKPRLLLVTGLSFLVIAILIAGEPAKSAYQYFHREAFTAQWNNVTFNFPTPWVQVQHDNGWGNFYRDRLPWGRHENIPWPVDTFHSATITFLPADSDFASAPDVALSRWQSDHGQHLVPTPTLLPISVSFSALRNQNEDFRCADTVYDTSDGRAYVDTDCISLKNGWRFDYEGSKDHRDEAVAILAGSHS